MSAKRRVLKRKILTVRVTPEDYRRVTQAAKVAGMERAEWIRRAWERQFEDQAPQDVDTKAAA